MKKLFKSKRQKKAEQLSDVIWHLYGKVSRYEINSPERSSIYVVTDLLWDDIDELMPEWADE